MKNRAKNAAIQISNYSPYGYTAPTAATALAYFNGEYLIQACQAYSLGAGHRLYSPSLMRFFSSDSISPFGKGGINSYTYCLCDPINFSDKSGKSRGKFIAIPNAFGEKIYTSTRPVKLPALSRQQQVALNQHPIEQTIMKHLGATDRNSLRELNPNYHINNTNNFSASLKNSESHLPALDYFNSMINDQIKYGFITPEKALPLLQRRITALKAGFTYETNQASIAFQRTILREENERASLNTSLLWR